MHVDRDRPRDGAATQVEQVQLDEKLRAIGQHVTGVARKLERRRASSRDEEGVPGGLEGRAALGKPVWRCGARAREDDVMNERQPGGAVSVDRQALVDWFGEADVTLLPGIDVELVGAPHQLI